MPTEVDPREERQARSLALEKAYVHDVYDQIAPHFTDTRYRAWPRVKQFLLELEPASLVADVGCGNGKYLDINPDNLTVGCDRCSALTEAAKARGHEVVTCDNLQLPFRDESFDAALSVAVIHHFATTERRVEAIRELARVLRIGGKVLITVWAMEQRHRKFDSQDVLVPWHEPVKSSSEDRASSVEREMTSTTTSDDDVLVYHAYSHISDSEAHPQGSSSTHHSTNNVSRKRQKYRNGRGRYRSAGSFDRCNGSRSSSELSSPNETCYSFVKRALQKLSSSGTTNSPHSSKRSNARPYFYRSCRKPWASASMEFGKDLQKDLNTNFPRPDLYQQSSLESECPDQPNVDDVPIELRHLEGYESCMNCGSPVRETAGVNHCETNVCASCLPIDPDSGKKSRSLGDFLNMIPKLLRVKKCEKEPLGDLQKRISTASDPREYMVKSRGSNVNGIVRSKSTVSFMSRLEEIMSLSISSSDRNGEMHGSSSSSKINNKFLKLPSLTSPTSVMVADTGNNDPTTVILQDTRDCVSTNPRRYNSPADALRKLRQDVSLDDASFEAKPDNSHKLKGKDDAQPNELASKNETVVSSEAGNENVTEKKPPSGEEGESNQESHLASYYSMPELYKLLDDRVPNNSMFPTRHRQRHISFYEQAQTILGENEPSNTSNSTETRRHELTVSATGECSTCNQPQRGLVKRSLSVDTGDNASSHQCPRRFSASAAQGVLASALRTYCLPRSSSRGSSVKSDTSVDSEESIVSVIPRKGNSITSDTSVDSEESVVSIIQRSTSEIETLVRESGLRNNISRLGSRSARASPVTVLSSQTSSAESSPPQSGKNDGKFPGTGAVIDQLMQQHQQQMSIYCLDGVHLRHDAGEHILKMRRSLMRPVSDPKIEDRLLSNNSEENTGGHKSSTSRQGSGSNASSIESDDKVIKEEDEKSDTNSIRRASSESIPKALETEKKKELPQMGTSGDLSRTPSPIGPFKYIDDPLLTGVAPLDFTSEALKSASSYNDHAKSGSEQCNTDACDTEQNSFADETCLDSPTSDPPTEETDKASELHETPNNEEKSGVNDDSKPSTSSEGNDGVNDDSKPSTSSEGNDGVNDDSKPSTSSEGNERNIPVSSEEERYAKLRKLSQRIENLGLSSELLKSFYMSSEDNESPDTSPVSGGDPLSEKSCNIEDNSLNQESTSETCEQDTVLEKSDEESFIDESLKTVIQDNKRVVENSLESDCSIKEPETENLSASSFQQQNISHDAFSDYPKPHSSSSSEIKNNIRSGFKKRLIRSCITIDEVECRRDPISSEDTSPSSSTSLEWNDFDKMEAQEAAAAAAAAASGATSSANMPYFRRNSASAKNVEDVRITSPEDVNVAETENKYNVFLDKEICVFFETPSSSIGKSASSSSNATDFSTTSDRIRGAMQREKSDDRSSKESDSDNLSKLSDLEAKSDSAFSEDFARKTDLASSSSSASLDIIDTYGARTKMGSSESSWCDYDGPWVSSSSTKEKQPQQQPWILDNIDEIPDDDKHCEDDVRSRGKNGNQNQEVEDWPQDNTMDFVKRRENFFSCAADCRDMYRISFDDSSPNSHHNSSEVKEASAGEMPDNIPQEEEAIAAESSAELRPAAKNSEDNEAAPTDILAAFVETISDLTSVFGELYPRHEGKFEDISSDDSIEISSFERILTSKEPQPSKEEQFGGKESGKNEDKGLGKDKVESSKAAQDGIRMARTKTNSLSQSTDTVSKELCDSVPAKDELSKSQDSHKTTDNSPIKRNIQKQDSDDSSGLSDVPKFEKREVSKTSSKKKVEDLDLRKKIPDSFNSSPKPKQFLQRSSQSVCTEKSRQDSTDKEEDSVPTTQSAPCSPRMKPRQRSVEEVLSRSKAELSRNSSLSQSTSQESLPGNENGGLMAYHRYYHVFRQGELDGLIDNYVENLHIISSYYDHANWCVVAEKVQVWTI